LVQPTIVRADVGRLSRDEPDGKTTMIASLIFVLLFLTLCSARSSNRRITLALYFVSLAAMLLLFFHHVTDPLNISL